MTISRQPPTLLLVLFAALVILSVSYFWGTLMPDHSVPLQKSVDLSSAGAEYSFDFYTMTARDLAVMFTPETPDADLGRSRAELELKLQNGDIRAVDTVVHLKDGAVPFTPFEGGPFYTLSIKVITAENNPDLSDVIVRVGRPDRPQGRALGGGVHQILLIACAIAFVALGGVYLNSGAFR